MSEPTRLTDDQITSMLLERAGSPFPPDLPTSVLASVRDARHRDDRLLRRGATRLGMLLVAATLVMAGTLLVASFAGSRLTTPPPSGPALAFVDGRPAAAVRQLWITDQSPAFTVTRDPSDKAGLYWRATTSDHIDLTGWSQSQTTMIARPRGASLFDKLADDVETTGHRRLTFTITPDGFGDRMILSPATPVNVSESTKLLVVGQEGYFSSLERDGRTGPYTVTAVIAEPGIEPGQLNTAALRATGRDYPQEIIDLYTQVAPGSLGTNARSLRAKVLERASSDAPVDIANALLDLLRSGDFKYAVDVRDVDCAGISTVECFATFKIGFCQYYAITMAVILRDLGVPTRIVEGFLPGSREQSAAVEVVANSSAHAWVEVYFNDVGWVTYDPTYVGRATQVGPLPFGPSEGPR
jgi:transglutaminase-like putative cysteine protease